MPRSRECVLLLDENMSSPTIVEPLREFTDWIIKTHGDCLDPGATDDDVVTFCGRNDYALVSLDEMRYTPETTEAIRRHNVAVFKVVTHKETHFVVVASALIQARRNIVSLVRKNRTGFCAHVYQNGRVRIVTRFEDTTEVLTESQQKTMRKFGRVG